MKKKQIKKLYFFVDESGDPYFYDRHGNFIVDKEGCSKILILGFIKTESPKKIRKEILKLRQEIKKDKYLKNIPSIKKTLLAFHAKDDCPEVREKVYKKIVSLPFKAELYVARKIESVFIKRHKKRPNIFYDDLITKLFKNQLHLAKENFIYFAVRSNKARQQPLEDAIRKAKLSFEEKWKAEINSDINIFPQRSQGEPCLQIVDYISWAVQRAFIKKDMRFFKFIEDKISLLVDLYDFDKYKSGGNYYNKRNKFDIKKISPL